jgi:putative chitinase
MEIKFEQLQSILPTCNDIIGWTVLLNKYLPAAGIDSPEEISRFLAQLGHESADLNTLTENLNYSAPGLLKTFGKYFDHDLAIQYARQPQRIANRVYANRMSNGSEASGDGWKFRGAGPLQLTGKSNFLECSEDLFKDQRLIANPEFVRLPDMGLQAALWFWNKNKLNSITDMILLTRRINGGKNGLNDRLARYDIAIKILKD